MFLARVEGSVVATKKDPSMGGRKLLLLRPQLVDEKDPSKFRPGVNTIVAVDSVGAGIGELVMFCQGSSARLAPNLKDAPVVAEVLGRLGQTPSPGSSKHSCGCGNGQPSGASIGHGKHGVFQDANEACAAAQAAFLELKKKGVAAREKVVQIVKTMADTHAIE